MSLPVTAEPLPTSITFGKVVGRVIHLIADTAEDTDDKPQARAAAGKVTFTPKEVVRRTTEADYPAIVLHAPEEATLSATGRILDAEGRQGIWLATGVYSVTFTLNGGKRDSIPSFDVAVTAEHTDAAPLDLAKEVPYVPPSGTTVQTVLIPSGGTTGQVLVRTASGALEWADQTADVDLTGYVTDQELTDAIAAIPDPDLSGYATTTALSDGLTANSTDDRARANHTGTQAASTITGLADVATTGAYADLTGTPIIPTETVESIAVHGADTAAPDNRAAIQATINAVAAAGGGTVHVPVGTWRIIGALALASHVTIAGVGENSSVIHQTSTTANGVEGVDLSHVALRNLRLLGPGPYTGTGSGVKFTLSGTAGNATFYPVLRDVRVEEFGVDGVDIDTPIVSELARVVAFKNGRHGIYLHSAGDIAGTSVTLTSCFPAGNHGAGYRIDQMAYCTLNACAADANGIGYDYDTCYGLVENGCGSEEPYDFSGFQAGYTGESRRLINCRAVLNAPYSIGNVGTAYRIGLNSVVTISSPYESSPGNPDSPTNSPTASLRVEAGAKVWLSGESFVTPMVLAPGTTRRGGIVPITQAEYDALTPDDDTLYVIN